MNEERKLHKMKITIEAWVVTDLPVVHAAEAVMSGLMDWGNIDLDLRTDSSAVLVLKAESGGANVDLGEVVRCWCGMYVARGRLHYPGDGPEDGPAHKPSAENPNEPQGPEPLAPCTCSGAETGCEHSEWCPQSQFEGPNLCWVCNEEITKDQPSEMVTVDDDPGDPEVGPQPDIMDVLVHSKCRGSRPQTVKR